jgi:hypothetical protein
MIAVVYMVGIFALSALPEFSLKRLGLPVSVLNMGHIPLYAGFAGITLWALVGPRLRCIAAAMILCAAFAISDEWHQSFVPGRVADVEDLVADGAGIVLGLAIVAAIPASWRPPKESKEEGVET